MVKMTAVYQGNLHCELSHEPSHSKIETDAPTDNQGKGERFSPTDLVGAALASCILTTMAIVADRDKVSIEGARAEVEKEMVSKPHRQVGSLSVKISLPKTIPQDYRAKIEHVAHVCPVHRSLNPEIKIPVEFSYV